MKNVMLKTSIFLLTFSLALPCKSQAVFIGPTLHYNFGGEKRTFSYGIEASFWTNIVIDAANDNRKYTWPYGFDLGFEFENNKKRFYTELQTGPLIGISSGAVVEWSKENPTKIGFQGSAWFVFFGGLDARIRIFKDEKLFSPGILIKVPLYFYGDNLY